MPLQDQQKVKETIKQLIKKAKNYDDRLQFDISSKIYTKLLRIDPATVKNYHLYAGSLSKANNKQQACRILRLALINEPKNLSTYNLLMECMFDMGKNQQLIPIIKKAIQIDQNNAVYCTKYARACHGAKKFRDGLDMIEKFEQKGVGNINKWQKAMMWRSYLHYQLGQYDLAYKFTSEVLKLTTLSENDTYYYQIQRLKYSILMKNYQDVESVSAKLIENQKIELSTRLKTYALRAFYFSQLGSSQKALQSLQLALKASCNDQMTQCKWSLMNIILLDQCKLHVLKSNLVQQRLEYVLRKMLQVKPKDFEDHNFSQHFNWYEQMGDFINNIKFIIKNFDEIQYHLQLFKEYALNMLLTLLEGFQNCIKLNKRLYQIQVQIQQTKIKNLQSQNQQKILVK